MFVQSGEKGLRVNLDCLFEVWFGGGVAKALIGYIYPDDSG